MIVLNVTLINLCFKLITRKIPSQIVFYDVSSLPIGMDDLCEEAFGDKFEMNQLISKTPKIKKKF